MPRPPSDNPTAARTVSLAVSPAEAAEIATVSGVDRMTKSGWILARTIKALSSGQRRAAVLTVAQHIEADGQKGARTARVSTVMQPAQHDEVKAAATQLGLTVHSFMQAVALGCANNEIANVPKNQRVVVERVRATTKKASPDSMMVVVPEAFAEADLDALSAMLRQLVAATCTKIREGGAKPLMEGVPKFAAGVRAKPTVALRLAVPEFEIMAAAHVLGLPAADYATALATRAAQSMGAK